MVILETQKIKWITSDKALFIFLLPKLAYMKIGLYLYCCTQNILPVMESLYVVL